MCENVVVFLFRKIQKAKKVFFSGSNLDINKKTFYCSIDTFGPGEIFLEGIFN